MPDFAEIRSSDKDTTHGPGLDEIARDYGAKYPKAVASLRRAEIRFIDGAQAESRSTA